MDELIITVAPVGAELTRREFPTLALTPGEIADEVYRCWNEGASIAHLHARTTDGRPTQSAQVYKEIIERIKAKCDIVIQVSTGGAVDMKPSERIEAIDSAPEMATLTLGTINFGKDIFFNPLETVEHFAKSILEMGIKPELEVFDLGMVYTAFDLIDRNYLLPPFHWSIMMGVSGGVGGSIRDLSYIVGLLPENDTWQVGGIGQHQLPLSAAAIAMGGHVRVGAEDNIYLRAGEKITSSAQLVARAALS